MQTNFPQQFEVQTDNLQNPMMISISDNPNTRQVGERPNYDE